MKLHHIVSLYGPGVGYVSILDEFDIERELLVPRLHLCIKA